MSSPHRSSLVFASPIGFLRVTATRDHLVEVKLRAPEQDDRLLDDAATTLCRRARQEIEAFLAGDLQQFVVPWRIFGDRLKQRVLGAMAKIPYARTVTYGGLAQRAGESVGASRVVGAICGSNPLPLVIPCHRVLGAQGLGGFGGGIAMKRWLLQLEITGRPPRPLTPEEIAAPKEEMPVPAVTEGRQQSLFDD